MVASSSAASSSAASSSAASSSSSAASSSAAAVRSSSAATAGSSSEVVLAFLACGGRRDLAGAEALLDEDVVRTGPDGDVKSGRASYLAYLQSALGGALDYRYEVRRCMPSADGQVVVVEIDEWLTEADGHVLSVSEAMLFDVTDAHQISQISVYTKSPAAGAG